MNRIYILLLFLGFFGFSQKQSAFWYFGQHAGLDFNSGSPVAVTDGKISTMEGCATISTIDGVLLFYTDGVKVYNSAHQQMQNGSGLRGNTTSTNSSIIVPKPEDPNIYYIFTTPTWSDDGLRYSIVDMSQNNGLGAVTSKNNLLAQPVAEKLTAVKTADNDGYWVLAHSWDGNDFIAYKVTSAGVDTNPIISNSGHIYDHSVRNAEQIGAMKFSFDSNKLAVAINSYGLELHDFDSSTGIVSAGAQLRADDFAYGVEFSPNSQILYMSSPVGGLFQYDLTQASKALIRDSEIAIKADGGGKFWALQLGLDGKIYQALDNSNYLSIIENPNALGSSCNYNPLGLHLGGKKSRLGLPAFVQAYFKTSPRAENFCLGSPTLFEADLPENYLSVLWNFGDGETSTELQPSHEYSAPGHYVVEFTITQSTGLITDTLEIDIVENPIVNNIENIEVCPGVNQFDLSTLSATLIGSQADVQISYHISDTHAHADISRLNDIINISPEITVYARLSRISSPDCYVVYSFDILKGAGITAGAISQMDVCLGPNDNKVIDLNSYIPTILNGKNPDDFNVLFYKDLVNAVNRMNPLTSPYPYTSDNQEIFYRLEKKDERGCYDVESSKIKEAQPSITTSEFFLCGDNGFSQFQLKDFTVDILGNLNPSEYEVWYYLDESTASTDGGYLDPNSMMSNTSTNQQIIYAKVQHKSMDCNYVGPITLNFSQGVPEGIVNNWSVCDNTGTGSFAFDLSQKNSEILNGANPNDYSISYFLSQNDADNNINSINRNYTSNSPSKSIFYRIEEKNMASCFATGAFELQIQNGVIINEVQEYFICSSSGVDLDAIASMVNSFLNGESPNNFNISLHGSQTEAESKTNNINPLIFLTTTTYDQDIFIRIERKTNPECFVISSFRLVITTNPETYNIPNWTRCNSGNSEQFNLTEKNPEILGNRNPADFDISYFLNDVDAESNQNKIGPTINLDHSETIFYRLVNKGNTDCYNIGSFEIELTESLQLNTVPDQSLCTETGDVRDELNLIIEEIIGNPNLLDYNLGLFKNQSDAETSTDKIDLDYFADISSYSNVLFLRVSNKNDDSCFAITSFNLQISLTPKMVDVTDWAICVDGGNRTATFDLSEKNDEILNGLSNADFEIEYYSSQIEAENRTNPLNINHQVVDHETIYFRISNINKPECHSIGDFTIYVSNAINFVPKVEYSVCTSNGLTSDDIDEMIFTLLDYHNPANFQIRFYGSYSDLETEQNEIDRSELIGLSSNMEIFYKINNFTYPECYRIFSTDIEITYSPSLSDVSNYFVCGNGHDKSFNFAEKLDEIFIGLNPNDYFVNFYKSEEDAINAFGELNMVYVTNTSETIYYRVEHVENSTCFSIGNFDIEFLNNSEISTIPELSNCGIDGFSEFDLAQKRNDILADYSSDYSVEFYLSQNDAQLSQNEISSQTFTNTSEYNQQIFVKVQNESGCFSLGSFFVRVTEDPTAAVPQPLVICGDAGTESMWIDLSVKNNEILQNVASEDYSISYFTTFENAEISQGMLVDSQFECTNPSETVYAKISRDNEECYTIVPVEIAVNQVQAPEIPQQLTLCDANDLVLDGGDFESWEWLSNNEVVSTERSMKIETPGNYILWVSKSQNGLNCENYVEFNVAETEALNDFDFSVDMVNGIFNIEISTENNIEYEFSLDGNEYKDSEPFTLNPGRHTVYVRDLQSCNTLSKVIFLPRFKNFFSPNDDGRNDDWLIFSDAETPIEHTIIFDRYGKILATLTDLKRGWDGNYEGKPMPADDYWFLAVSTKGEEFRGHFALVR